MVRKTENEKVFGKWCRENGGDIGTFDSQIECKHPTNGRIIFRDAAMEGNDGDLVVPWSDSTNNDKDVIMFKGSDGFDEINQDSEKQLTFLNQDNYRFAEVEFGEEGFNLVGEGNY